MEEVGREDWVVMGGWRKGERNCSDKMLIICILLPTLAPSSLPTYSHLTSPHLYDPTSLSFPPALTLISPSLSLRSNRRRTPHGQ